MEEFMKLSKLGVGPISLSLATVLLLAGVAPASADEGQPARTVSGEVLKITGTFALVKGPNGKGVLDVASDTVVVQEEGGQQVALRVGKDTKQAGIIDAGDRIEASVGPDGQIISIRSAKAPQAQRP
jgi:hypothetical protein